MAPILTSFSLIVVSDQCSTSFGNARVRPAVERTFSQLKGCYRFTRMRYRGLAANAFHLDLVAVAYNLRTAAAVLA